jgi:hypothetical protein
MDDSALRGNGTRLSGLAVELAHALVSFDLRNPDQQEPYRLIRERLARGENSSDYLSWRQQLGGLDPRWMTDDLSVPWTLVNLLLRFADGRLDVAEGIQRAAEEAGTVTSEVTAKSVERMVLRVQLMKVHILGFWDYLRREQLKQMRPQAGVA